RLPDWTDAAAAARGAAVLVHRVGGTVHLEGLVLGGGHDVAHRDRARVPGQVTPTLGATHTLHEAGTAQTKQDLFDVVPGETLLLGDLAGSHRSIPRLAAPRQVDG